LLNKVENIRNPREMNPDGEKNKEDEKENSAMPKGECGM